MDEGVVYLLIALPGVLLTLGGYLAYLARRGRFAQEELEHTPLLAGGTNDASSYPHPSGSTSAAGDKLS